MTTVFQAIADPTRRRILDRLATKERSVTELAHGFDMTLPAVSQHLKILRDTRLVSRHRDGRRIYYQLRPGPLREISRWVNTYERFWQTRLDALEVHLKKKHDRLLRG